MPVFTKKIILTSILISFAAQAQTPPQGTVFEKVSLQDAIKTAIDKNLRSKSNTLRLEGAAENLKAKKQSAYLPTISTGYSQDLKSPSSRSLSATIQMNLFNNFADYYAIKAGECNYKRLEASYKSTNAHQQNTTGQIIGSVTNNYISLVSVRQNQTINKMTIDRLQLILPFAKNSTQKENIESQINLFQISIQESKSDLKIAERNYENIVNSEAPAQTDTFNEIIEKTTVPQNADEAFKISLTKSPEILGAKLSLECDQLSRKAERANLYGISVDASAKRSTDFNAPSKNETALYLSARVPFDLSRITSYKAGDKYIEATKLDLEDTIKKNQLDLINGYDSLFSAINSESARDQLYNANELKIDSKLSNLIQLNDLEIDALIANVTLQNQQFKTNNYQKREIINTKYNIQKDIGTLFDTNQLFINN